MELLKQGAEAKIYQGCFLGENVIVKERFKKNYRHATLDEKLTHRRTLQEVRSMIRCRKLGVRTPVVYFIDFDTHSIYMEYLEDTMTARDFINQELLKGQDCPSLLKLAEDIGIILAKMHGSDIIHGDLTTSNILVDTAKDDASPIMIDFGLSSVSGLAEDKGVDLYVLERAILSTHPKADKLFNLIIDSYSAHLDSKMKSDVIKKLDEVRQRGRKRLMVG